MLSWFTQLDPVLQATLGGIFTWGCTALGSSLVFLFNNVNRKMLDIMNGFAAGVMIAASYWSLLAPSIEYAENSGYGNWAFFPALIGFLIGGIALRGIDAVVPHLHFGKPRSEAEGVKSSLTRPQLLFLSITIHNIPEGLAIGVAFGAAAAGDGSATLISALILSLGIGLQNFPEGAALTLPIRAEGQPKFRAFNIGQSSAIVEIFSAALGAWLVNQVSIILPYALAFAAGAMIFVCIEELIPDSQRNGNHDLATLSFMIGFALMMTLDVALG